MAEQVQCKYCGCFQTDERVTCIQCGAPLPGKTSPDVGKPIRKLNQYYSLELSWRDKESVVLSIGLVSAKDSVQTMFPIAELRASHDLFRIVKYRVLVEHKVLLTDEEIAYLFQDVEEPFTSQGYFVDAQMNKYNPRRR